MSSKNTTRARVDIFDSEVEGARTFLKFRHRGNKLQTRTPVNVRKRQRTPESSRVCPQDQQHQKHYLCGKSEGRCSREVIGKSILRDALALMVFVKGNESIAAGDSVERELQIIIKPDAAIRYDVRVAEYNYFSVT